MGFTCGIVGLPNVGKSTIFNALTSCKAASENFPFCTIEPNTGVVPVPDPRLNELAALANSAKIIPTQMTFVDIAGLIKGAAEGEGLGNQFLGHIRSVDAVAHVVRCFSDENIVHVDGSVDPLRDVETIETELLLADLQSIEKQRDKAAKNARAGTADAKKKLEVVLALEEHLAAGKNARSFLNENDSEIAMELCQDLLTAKPVLYVANVSEDDISREPQIGGDHPIDALAEFAKEREAKMIVISGKVESELAELSADERLEFLKDLDVTLSGLDRLILAGYETLNLLTFFTIGPKEAHAWTVAAGATAPQTAGKIHTDFDRGFIRAEVISYEDYVAAGSELKAKEAGKMRVEGKDYITKDGDIFHFRFNV